jgi:cytochrome b subunit of formate dehydrogenase
MERKVKNWIISVSIVLVGLASGIFLIAAPRVAGSMFLEVYLSALVLYAYMCFPVTLMTALLFHLYLTYIDSPAKEVKNDVQT